MDWFEVALQNPVDNWGVWFFVAIGLIKVLELMVGFLHKSQQSNTDLMQAMQANTSTDNSIQSRLLEEMTARRLSDEKMKTRLTDLIEATLLRIENSNNVNQRRIIRQGEQTHHALKTLYRELRRQERKL